MEVFTAAVARMLALALIAGAAGCAGDDPSATGDAGARGDGAAASIRRGSRCENNDDCTPGDVCFHERCRAARTEGQSCEYGGQCRRSPAPVLFCVDERCTPCADRCPRRTVCDPGSGECVARTAPGLARAAPDPISGPPGP